MKTSKKQFERFKEKCLELQKDLGLVNYQLCFHHQFLDNNRVGNVTYNSTQLWADISLTTKHHSLIDEDSIAVHEMLHLVLGRLDELAYERFIRPQEIEDENESIVRVLTRYIKELGG